MMCSTCAACGMPYAGALHALRGHGEWSFRFMFNVRRADLLHGSTGCWGLDPDFALGIYPNAKLSRAACSHNGLMYSRTWVGRSRTLGPNIAIAAIALPELSSTGAAMA